jgi:hypothetical protein
MLRPDNIYAPGAFDVSRDPPRERPVANAIRMSARAARLAAMPSANNGGPRNRTSSGRYQGWWQRSDRFTLRLR